MFAIDLDKVPNNKAIAVVLIIAISILGPLSYFFIYAQPALNSYNIAILLLLCASIGFPIVVANSLFSVLALDCIDKKSDWPAAGIFGAMFSIIPLYIPSFIGYLAGKPLRNVIYYASLTQLGLFLFLLFYPMIIRRAQRRSNTPAAPADPLPPSPLPETPSDI